jgi:hypothetical protein
MDEEIICGDMCSRRALNWGRGKPLSQQASVNGKSFQPEFTPQAFLPVKTKNSYSANYQQSQAKYNYD